MSQNAHLSLHPGGLLPNPLQFVASSSSSLTRTRNLSGKGQPWSAMQAVGVCAMGPKEREPHHIQEIYPPSFLISPSHPGSFSAEAEINHLDGVGP